VNGVPVRTWALPEKAHLTRFGQDAALAALPRLQEYFGLPYAYGKVDQVGIPDFEAGAMENAGLITYREVALLLDPATAPLSVQKRVAEVVSTRRACMRREVETCGWLLVFRNGVRQRRATGRGRWRGSRRHSALRVRMAVPGRRSNRVWPGGDEGT
jgi:hypothetical protein